MKSVVLSIVAVIALTNAAVAQNKKVYACLEQDTTGFKHQNGQYRNVRFQEGKFTLVIEGMTLTTKMGGNEVRYLCQKPWGSAQHLWSCNGSFNHIALNINTMRFERASLFGYIDDVGPNTVKDSLSVSYGDCQEF